MGRDTPLTRYALDTNILVYDAGVARAPGDDAKVTLCRELIDELLERRPAIVLSVHALAELHQILTRFGGRSTEQAMRSVERWSRLATVLPVAGATMALACELTERSKLQIFDAIIIASVAESTDIFLTEDLSDGQKLLGVLVRNPLKRGFRVS